MSRKKARLQVVVKIGGVWFFLGIKVISYIDGYSSYQANLRKTMCYKWCCPVILLEDKFS